MNGRRAFLRMIGATPLLHPLAAFAQAAPSVARIGILLFNAPQVDGVKALLDGLEALGYVQGRTITIDYRFAEGRAERLPGLAAELVALEPDLIFAFGGDVAPHVKKATASIPVIVQVSNDPVQSGLVASFGKPGGNLTGMTLVFDELAGKVFELLLEALPGLARVAVLWNPEHADPEFRETARAAQARGVALQSLEIRRAEDFDPAFEAAVRERAEAVIVVPSRILLQQRRRILAFARERRIPMAASWGNGAQDGLLLTFGPSAAGPTRRMADYADRILKGAHPGDLPFERPTRFELVLNLRTAKSLGIQIAPSLLARADEVLE
jgi:putative tryptophan/tyrosine transport system substrate-binding protein